MEKRVISRKALIAASHYVEERDYWLEKLSGAGELTRSYFPYDYNGEAKSKFFDLPGKGLVKTRFTGKLFTRLMEVSNGFDYTLHMIAVAVTVVLLHKYTYGSSEDIIVGAPIYKKEEGNDYVERVNTILALREWLNDNMTFKELLFQVRKTILEADKHKNYPLEVLVSQLNITMSEDYFPLFDVAVLLENIHDPDYLRPLNLNMIFSFLRTEESIEMEVHYNPLKYEKTTVERIAGHFSVLLRQVLFNADLRLLDADISTEEEKKQFLEDFNDVLLEYPRDKTIRELFEEQVSITPDGVAVIGVEQSVGARGAVPLPMDRVSITYGELNQKSNQLAHVLRSKGVVPDTIVGIMVERSVEMMIGILGILKAGGAYLPIDPNYPEERKKYILEDSKAALLLTVHDLLDVCRGTACRASICDGTACCAPTNLAYVIYTSGTTGSPKGAMVEHRNVINLVYGLYRNIYSQYQGNLKVVLVAPYVFDASVQQIFAVLLLGHTLCIVPEEIRIDGLALKKYYRKYCIDISDGTPTHLRLMVEDIEDNRDERGVRSGFTGLHLKHFIIGGEALPQPLLEDFLSRFEAPAPKITNVYGPTECSVDSTWYEISKETMNENHSIPIGKPMPNEQICIVNQQGQWQPIGVPGELSIGGDGVGRGYLNQPELTAEKFVSGEDTNDQCLITDDRFYLTGDLARWLPDGNIEFLGRIDHQVKIRGFRIELEEIEKRLTRYTYDYNDKMDEHAENISSHAVGFDRTGDKGKLTYCSRCVLSSQYPGIHFDRDGICNICREYEKYEHYAENYFKTIHEFHHLVETAQVSKKSEYDCMLLFSGGKDSSYVLYRLVEMGLKVLAFTFDNGYISDTAFENIKRITSRLGGYVDSIICRTPKMKEIFVESLSHDHTVCNGCFKALTTVSTRIAVEKGINMVITGLSRGQIFDTKLQGLYTQGIFDVKEVEEKLLLFRKIYHSGGDKISRLLSSYTYQKSPGPQEKREQQEEYGDIPIDTFTDDVLQDIHFLDFFRYDHASVSEIKSYLESKDIYWRQPGDTGFCSTNCIINDVGIYTFTRAYGYHNYAAPLSWDCRLGKITREEALKEIEFEPDLPKVNRILKEVGYFDRPIRDACVVDREDQDGNKYLCAYIVPGRPGKQEDIPGSRELREYLSRILPDYMIPSFFVSLEELPLTPNGKVDRKRLPEPEIKLNRQYTAPGTDIEKTIAEVWEGVLKLEKIGIHDNFFDLGGNSLGIIKVTRRLREIFKQNVPTAVIFLNPTINLLARYFNSKVTGEESLQDQEEVDRSELIDEGRSRLRSRLQRMQVGN